MTSAKKTVTTTTTTKTVHDGSKTIITKTVTTNTSLTTFDYSVPDTMKAVTFSSYGSSADVLEHVELPTPKLADDDTLSVIIKVVSAGVNPVDYKIVKGYLSAYLPMPVPAIPGADYSGIIVQVGSSVTLFNVGDKVYGKTAKPNGYGPYAEYIKVNSQTDLVTHMPASISFNEAGGISLAALTAYVGLATYDGLNKDAYYNKDKKVLVIGASGGVGMWAVQIAKRLGASVTAVASSRNKDFVLNTLKADAFIDYTQAPLAEQFTTADEFDVIYDSIGADITSNWDLAQLILKPGGLFVSPAGSVKTTDADTRRFKFVAQLPVSEFPQIAGWVAEGSVTPITTRALPLSEAKQAHELSASGRTVGKIVLNP
ncbi:NADPh quinone reductase [Chytriomyces hyalinus]|nr:NADPh quinone reductase [Chytriomyces hyalinus]